MVSCCGSPDSETIETNAFRQQQQCQAASQCGLDDVAHQAVLKQDVMQQPVGVQLRLGRLPQHDVAEQGGGTDEGGVERSEIEWRDSLREPYCFSTGKLKFSQSRRPI